MTEIKKGNTVRLKSGGPLMTVESLDDYTMSAGPQDGAACVWFDDKGNQQSQVFDLAVLEPAEG